LAVEKLGPIGAEMSRLKMDTQHIDAILNDGAQRAHALAQPNIVAVKNILGFVQPGVL